MSNMISVIMIRSHVELCISSLLRDHNNRIFGADFGVAKQALFGGAVAR